MEFNAIVIACCLFPLTLFDRYHHPKGNLAGRPILMVNGYLSFGSTWHYLRKKLAKAGFGPIYTMNVGSGKSIITYAHCVEEKVKEIQKETGRNDIAFIGHSKGGLVSSYFAACLAAEIQSEVTDIVTIGSPWSGTAVANYAVGLDACEMRSGSKFHQELRERMGANQTTRYFHVASETDEVVPQASSLIWKDPSRQLSVKDTGHLGLVFSSRVAHQICVWLK
jgi:pimeloyl-ACP methyl ester carboxylesterase